MDGRTDMMKQIVAFRSFSKAPKMVPGPFIFTLHVSADLSLQITLPYLVCGHTVATDELNNKLAKHLFKVSRNEISARCQPQKNADCHLQKRI
jgi:hypothetical protein